MFLKAARKQITALAHMKSECEPSRHSTWFGDDTSQEGIPAEFKENIVDVNTEKYQFERIHNGFHHEVVVSFAGKEIKRLSLYGARRGFTIRMLQNQLDPSQVTKLVAFGETVSN